MLIIIYLVLWWAPKTLIKEFPIWLKRQILKTQTTVTVRNSGYLRVNVSGEDKITGRYQKNQGRFIGQGESNRAFKDYKFEDEKEGHWS